MSTIEAVAIITEIEEQSQLSDLLSLGSKGFSHFYPIGAGLALLSRDKIESLPFEVEKEITTKCRFGEKGNKFDVEVNYDKTISVHIYGINEG